MPSSADLDRHEAVRERAVRRRRPACADRRPGRRPAAPVRPIAASRAAAPRPGPGSGDGPGRARCSSQSVVGRGRGGGADLVDEFVDVELGRLADVVDQEGDRRVVGVGVDACAVELAAEQLAAVPPPPEQLREPVAAQPEAGRSPGPGARSPGSARPSRPSENAELAAGRHRRVEGRPGPSGSSATG